MLNQLYHPLTVPDHMPSVAFEWALSNWLHLRINIYTQIIFYCICNTYQYVYDVEAALEVIRNLRLQRTFSKKCHQQEQFLKNNNE